MRRSILMLLLLGVTGLKADRITSLADSSANGNHTTFVGSAIGYYIWNCTNTTTGYGQWVQIPALFLTNCAYGPGIIATIAGGVLNITNSGQLGSTTLSNASANAANTVTNVSSTGGLVSSITTGTMALSGSTVCYGGSSGNFAIGTSQTIWWALNNSKTNQDATDVSGGTRTVICRGGTITNLYVVMSGTVGNNNSNWFGIFTNGVATSIAVLITGTSVTTGNDTAHSATVVAGDQIGIKCLSSSSVTAVKAAWGIEER